MKNFLSLLFLIVSLIVLSTPALADFSQSPPPFKMENGKTALFVDFKNLNLELTYDVKKRKAFAITHISFQAFGNGVPIFDSVNTPLKVLLNGHEVDHGLAPVPGKVSVVRYADQEISPGLHTMTIMTKLTEGIKFKRRSVSSGFFIKDLTDRKFLERFVVANYEYDQYQMTFNVKVKGTKRRHKVYANGEVDYVAKNHIQITYPNFYTASSAYFHLAPTRKFRESHFKFRSINGNLIPVTIYSRFRISNLIMRWKTKKILRELERDYGPWPHPRLLIYGTKLRGGMEYVGATATSLISLGHELQHSYFAKGILPANGNSGWMDEGIASWRDRGHKVLSKPAYNSFNLGNHNIYTRKTDSNSYEKGRSFFAYMDYKLKKAGKKGLKDFLRGYFDKRKFTTVTTQDFISDIQEYSGLDLTDDFDQYIFGKGYSKGRSPAVEPKNPHHRDYTDKEVASLL